MADKRKIGCWFAGLGCVGSLVFLVLILVLWVYDGVEAQREREFRGYYSRGSETSSFVECESNQAPGYGRGYWVVVAPDAGFEEAFDQIMPQSKRSEWGYMTPPVAVRVIGQRSSVRSLVSNGHDGYGHLGLYGRQLTVVKVLAMIPCPENQPLAACPCA